jgi:hypothetical protein
VHDASFNASMMDRNKVYAKLMVQIEEMPIQFNMQPMLANLD